jgi:small subunit ribosomal protein S9
MPDTQTPTPTSTKTPTSAATGAPAPAPTPAAKPDKGGFIWGTGRRKSAVARVRIKPGNGQFKINNREAKEYFVHPRDLDDAQVTLRLTGTEGQLDVFVNVHGGGTTGQAGAVMLGLARAIKKYDPTLEPILRDNDLLTRDPREVERKKYGQPGARRRFQFSKR